VALAYDLEPTTERTTLRLYGELDLKTVDELTNLLRESITNTEGANVAVDLSEVTFIDTTTISALIRAYKQAAQARQTLSVTGATGLVRRVLAVTGVLQLLTGRPRPDLDSSPTQPERFGTQYQ
jgi:anti-sigma B factor antagonist